MDYRMQSLFKKFFYIEEMASTWKASFIRAHLSAALERELPGANGTWGARNRLIPFTL